MDIKRPKPKGLTALENATWCESSNNGKPVLEAKFTAESARFLASKYLEYAQSKDLHAHFESKQDSFSIRFTGEKNYRPFHEWSAKFAMKINLQLIAHGPQQDEAQAALLAVKKPPADHGSKGKHTSRACQGGGDDLFAACKR